MLDTVPPETRLRARAHHCARWAGLAAGVVVASQLATVGQDLGVGILYAIPAFGLCAVGGVLLGDALTPRPKEAVRTAGLAPRRIPDHLPPRMARLLLGQAALLVVLLTAAAAVASPDDLGRAGRSLSVACQGRTEAASPWPGLYYGLPVLLSLALGSAACGWALRRIAHRPGEEQQRRDRALAITAAWGLLVAVPLAGTAVTAAGSLSKLTCDGLPGTAGQWLLYPVGLVALVTAMWCLCTVAAPRATRR
ncbi:hypothetical protein [Streptomyces inhibens]|uniref:hypothetical protein n=1 Tax=Streptomyces inhibens TaxID=2293571 RepID=UPI001EE71C59|nr:hypothetical protein [Streptomyces inhibens]UKY51251.1 hypothetical protein KI385_22200 [Streptomyces inhibens]